MHRLQAFFFALFASRAFSSTISTFSDDKCKDSFEVFNGPNGYPNGTCVELKSHGSLGSFQVTQLDDGCGVTIYHKDATPGSPCSDESPILADVGTCYNSSSWVYFSIDNCLHPGTTTSAPNTAVATTLSTSVSTTAGTATAATTTSSSSSSSSSGGSSTNVGAIVGGVVGGVVGLALIALAAWFLWLRDGRSRSQPPTPPRGSSPDFALYPMKKGGVPGDPFETGATAATTSAGVASTVVTDNSYTNTNSSGRVQELEPTPNRTEMPTTGTWTKYELSSTETSGGEPKFYAELPGNSKHQ